MCRLLEKGPNNRRGPKQLPRDKASSQEILETEADTRLPEDISQTRKHGEASTRQLLAGVE